MLQEIIRWGCLYGIFFGLVLVSGSMCLCIYLYNSLKRVVSGYYIYKLRYNNGR